MGNSQSQLQIEKIEQQYEQVSHREHPFFGNYTLLVDGRRRHSLMRKDIVFSSDNEYQQYLKEYQKIQRKPFSLIYPTHVVEKQRFQNCSAVKEIKVYFQSKGPCLLDIVQREGTFSEVKAWFLLNEISKALEIMNQNYNRSHWAVSPETVYRNSTNNYLLYDSYFVFGNDPTHFLSRTKQNNGPLTQKIKMLIDRGSYPGPEEGMEQDTYALGFTIIYALTGVLANTLPPYPLQPHDIENLLASRQLTLSREIIDLLKKLTHRNSSKRMDIVQLRRFLKQKEAEIIHNESTEYFHSRRKSKSNEPHCQPGTFTFRPPESRVRFNSPSFTVHQTSPSLRRAEFSPPPPPPVNRDSHLKDPPFLYSHQQPRINLKLHCEPHNSSQVVNLSRLKSLDYNRPKK